MVAPRYTIRVGCTECRESTQLFCEPCDVVVVEWTPDAGLGFEIPFADVAAQVLLHLQAAHLAPTSEAVMTHIIAEIDS